MLQDDIQTVRCEHGVVCRPSEQGVCDGESPPASCSHRTHLGLATIPGLEHDSLIDDPRVVVQPTRQAHVELNVVQPLHVAQQVEQSGQLCQSFFGCWLLRKRVCQQLLQDLQW